MSQFTVYPAIDLRRGRVVRLAQGDPARQTVYADDPSEIAHRWIQSGISWLHVVNLDGAFEEPDEPNQRALQAIQRAASQNDPPVQLQFGGGLRSLAAVQHVFSLGIRRVILGTLAIQSPLVVTAILEKYGPQSLAVSLDVLHGTLMMRGWQEESLNSPLSLAAELAQLGVRTIIFSDIARDGLGTGVDIAAAQELAQATGLQVILAGGVASLADIKKTRQAGLSGVIIGHALYEGKIDLQEALAC